MKLRTALVIATASILAATLGMGCGETATDETPAAEERPSGTTTMTDETGVGVGDVAPGFTLEDLDGNTVSLSDFAGKVVVVDLWATWCPPCKAEIPFLVSLDEEFGDQGLEIVGIGLDQGGPRVLAPFVKDYGVDYTILVGTTEVARAYQASSIPTTVIIGRDGRVVARHVGYSTELGAEMKATIESLVLGQEQV